MRMTTKLCLSMATLTVISVPAFAQTLTWVGTLGGTTSIAYGVSLNGTVVGASLTAQGRWHAFLWDSYNSIQDLGILPGGSQSRALAISADGRVVVGVATNGASQDRAFCWTSAVGMFEIGTLGGARSSATGVSWDGTYIVGWAHDASSVTRAFRWTQAGGMQDIGTLGGTTAMAYGVSRDGTVVVGVSNLPQGWQRAFAWYESTGMQNLHTLGGTRSGARGVSAGGDVVVGGSYNDSLGVTRAFRWTHNTGITQLPILPGFLGSEAVAASCDGSIIVGRAYNPDSEPAAVCWVEGIGVQNLNVAYANLLSLGSYLYEATGISPDGRYIVGVGFNAQTNRSEGFLLDTGPTCVPHNGDVNRDGCVDDSDLLTVLFAFGAVSCQPNGADTNCDGIVDDTDLLTVIFHFGEGC